MTQLVRWQPLRDFDDLVGDLDRWFASVPRHLVGDGKLRRFVPSCEVLERDDETVLRFDIPGIDPEHDLEVTVEGDTLRVSGERRGRSEEASGQVRYAESSFGRFERCLTLPEGTEHDRTIASGPTMTAACSRSPSQRVLRSRRRRSPSRMSPAVPRRRSRRQVPEHDSSRAVAGKGIERKEARMFTRDVGTADRIARLASLPALAVLTATVWRAGAAGSIAALVIAGIAGRPP